MPLDHPFYTAELRARNLEDLLAVERDSPPT
jgi:hypothetical protein